MARILMMFRCVALTTAFTFITFGALAGCSHKQDSGGASPNTTTSSSNLEQNLTAAPASAYDLVDVALGKEQAFPRFLGLDEAWRWIQAVRVRALNTYLGQNKAGFDAFAKAPIGTDGTPALILRLLPDVLPQLWNDAAVANFTGLYKLQSSDPLYYGMAFTKAPSATPAPLFAQFTCGACHTGRVQGPDGQLHQLVGAPNTQFDINGFQTLIGASVIQPGFTYAAFLKALLTKADGAMYGADRIADEKTDKAIFQSPAPGGGTLGEAILNQFKDGVLQRGALVQQTLGAYSYHGDTTLLQSTPGHVEAFGFATLAFMPKDELKANPAAAVQKYLSPNPSVTDIMSVWRQADRSSAQWDGNILNKLIRNLGAELGVAGDPKAVNYQNAVQVTPFVAELPAPVYPFKVNLWQAATGRLVYQYACASCHDSEKFMGIAAVGTEPGRATGLTVAARLLLVANLKAACIDQANPLCHPTDNEVIVPRQSNPGYLALPLTGIWARAPYLHNGSIPTMAQLLIPATRPSQFKTGNLQYDQQNLGFAWEQGSKTYDTSILGYSNKGHADIQVFNGGIDFAEYPRLLEGLLEYLKTL